MKTGRVMRQLLLLISVFLCTDLFAQSQEQRDSVTPAQAYSLVRESFQGKDVDYFLMEDAGHNYWQIFVDAQPLQGWSHESYMFTVSKYRNSEGHIDILKEERDFPPRERFERLNDGVRMQKSISLAKNDSPILKESTLPNPDAGHTYAIILSGGLYLNSNFARYWNDCSFIYQTLTKKFHIPKSHIFPLMADGNSPAIDTWGGSLKDSFSQNLDLDGDGDDEIKMAATKMNLQGTFESLVGKMQKNDHLFIFVIDHGGEYENGTAYICLWELPELSAESNRVTSMELASMLKPFCEKDINVNVVLGQCYSGAFIPDLTKIGCVVSTAAADEPSWACKDIPYDAFVYEWTCAVSGTNHKDEPIKESADTDGDGIVSMREAFVYAEANDVCIEMESPQYISTPESVGEDLSFYKRPQPIDLYIKDCPNDIGKEPNMSSDNLWLSPSIWVRNTDDGVEEHENPVFSSEHPSVIVYVRVANRGRKAYVLGQSLHLYWSRSSTGADIGVWNGDESDSNRIETGGKIGVVRIPSIPAGEYADIPVVWTLSDNVVSAIENDGIAKNSFDIFARISDSRYEDGEDVFPIANVRSSNDLAQKNFHLMKFKDISEGMNIFIRNIYDDTHRYSLHIVPNISSDVNIYSIAKVQLSLDETILSAWKSGGLKANDITYGAKGSGYDVQFNSKESTLENLTLKGYNFGKINLRLKPTPFNLIMYKASFDIVLKNEKNEIVGGKTIEVVPVTATVNPISIDSSNNDDGTVTLAAVGSGFTEYSWLSTDMDTLGKSESVTISPMAKDQVVLLVASCDNGEVATSEISLSDIIGIKSVEYTSVNQSLSVMFNSNVPEGASLAIASIFDGQIVQAIDVPRGDNMVKANISSLPSGMYVISYSVNGEPIDSKQFNK